MHLQILQITLRGGVIVYTWTLLDADGCPRAMQTGASDTAEHCRTDALSLLTAGHQAIERGHGLPSKVVTTEEAAQRMGLAPAPVSPDEIDVVPSSLSAPATA